MSDRELVDQILENPYLQYFLGLSAYRKEAPFHHSMSTHFRKRFSQEALELINTRIAQRAIEMSKKEETSREKDQDDPPRKGKLLVDTTCTPTDICYPRDLNLLNEAREKSEGMIDCMHKKRVEKKKKLRIYRQKMIALSASLSLMSARLYGEKRQARQSLARRSP